MDQFAIKDPDYSVAKCATDRLFARSELSESWGLSPADTELEEGGHEDLFGLDHTKGRWSAKSRAYLRNR
jgi:hypothetical protein